jgi:hypothetical protein
MFDLLNFPGRSFATQLRNAVKMGAKAQALHTRTTARFSPDTIEKWDQMVREWEDNPKKPNPFAETEIGKFFIFEIVPRYNTL